MVMKHRNQKKCLIHQEYKDLKYIAIKNWRERTKKVFKQVGSTSLY